MDNLSNGLIAAGIAGVGTDIVEIERIKRAAERSGGRFLERVFTPAERSYCDAKHGRFASYAARFAAKEAVLKALGCGLRFGWKDIEIVRTGGRRPEVFLHGPAFDFAEKKGISAVLVSMSHDHERAVAFALAAGAPCLEPRGRPAVQRCGEG